MSPFRLAAAVAAVAALSGAAATGLAATSPAQPMRVTIDIAAAGADGVVVPDNFAVRSGGTVTVTFRNHTALFHTFTIRALGISVLLRPHRSESVTFAAPHGVYLWRCVICGTRAHPHSHAMRGLMYAIVNA